MALPIALIGGLAGVAAAAAVAYASTAGDDESGKKKKKRKKKKPAVGGVVYVDLLEGLEHSGIYVGQGQIVSFSKEKGKIVSESRKEFVDDVKMGDTIYMSCDERGRPVGDKAAAKRARKKVGRHRDYSLVLRNCHQFVAGCLKGDFTTTESFFWELKKVAKEELGAEKWPRWGKKVKDG